MEKGAKGEFDARWLQIISQLVLLLAGAISLDFSVRPAQIALTFVSALATQWACLKFLGLRDVGYKSALVTAFGLSLLLRANPLWAHPLVALVAIASKFVVRPGGAHLFNPANLGVIFALTCLPGTWVSPGQWGQGAVLAAWLLILGGMVVHRVQRSDIAGFFLLFHLGFLGLRIAWLGQNPAIWFHRLRDGSLLLFAFFMISDPKTIPRTRLGRVVHAFVVAAFAYAWQFKLYRANALLWSLFLASFLVPLWNKIWLGNAFRWTKMPAKETA